MFFLVNFVKFLRTPISMEQLWWLLLNEVSRKTAVADRYNGYPDIKGQYLCKETWNLIQSFF